MNWVEMGLRESTFSLKNPGESLGESDGTFTLEMFKSKQDKTKEEKSLRAIILLNNEPHRYDSFDWIFRIPNGWKNTQSRETKTFKTWVQTHTIFKYWLYIETVRFIFVILWFSCLCIFILLMMIPYSIWILNFQIPKQTPITDLLSPSIFIFIITIIIQKMYSSFFL